MARERGRGVTPPRVVELLKKEVSEKSILAVSNATGLGLAAIGRYLKGIGEPTTASLQKLANYFKVSVPWLRGDIPGDCEEEVKRAKRFTNDWGKALAQQDNFKEELRVLGKRADYSSLVDIFLTIPEKQQREALEILRVLEKHGKSALVLYDQLLGAK